MALVFSIPMLASCGVERSSLEPPTLPAVELFNWGGQPISVSPPPDGWERQKEQSGGLRGVRFIKTGSGGEEIRLAEHHSLDKRDRCERLTELLADFDKLDLNGFRLRVQRARPYAEPPISDQEERLARAANASLDQAFNAFYGGDSVAARSAVTQALERAQRIRYSLDDVLDRVMFSADAYDSFGTVLVDTPLRATLGGRPSVSVDFTLDSVEREVPFQGRQVYVLENNRLFVLAFLGLEENLPLFEAILATVSFPPGQCVH
jgi:hypothetical protein